MSARALLPLLLFALLLVGGASAYADTPVALFQGFRGQVNFLGTEATLRMQDNKQPCRLGNFKKGVSATLQGIPSGATILSAQLYWAGSGNTPDYTVTLNGISYTALPGRSYKSGTTGNYNYFSGAADVTSLVAATGNGIYTFNDLSIDNGDPWCSAQGVVGGFALLVIYSHPSEAYRMLNLYEGFQYFKNNGIDLTLNDFAIPNPLPGDATGRLGHITWEGDTSLSGSGEDLLFNGYEMTDAINPSGNQFNSASNVTGDTASYGIDFDAYTVKAPVIQAGQTSATTTYRSGQDMVLLSAEIAALPYLPGADLTLAMARSGALQVGGSTDYTITVSNAGNDVETGPVTVVDTLPAGLALVSARGSGWTCNSAAGGGGQTIVTCAGAGPVASKASMPALTITVNPAASGNYVNSATVSGKSADVNPNNNAASDSAAATDPNAGKTTGILVFTTRACVAGEAIAASGTGTGCPRFYGPVTADALSSGQIYVTNTSGNPLLAAAVDAQARTLSAQLALSCAPKSPLAASYAGATLGCNGAAQTVQLAFGANSPSVAASFVYPDVGQLALSVSYNGATTTQPFVAQPAGVKFYKVLRAADQYPDLNGQSVAPDVAFAKAGEDVMLQVAATVGHSTAIAPSFGCEATPPAVTLSVESPAGHAQALAHDQAFVPVSGSAGCSGLLGATVQWYEAGLITLTPSLAGYLNTGNPVAGTPRIIGRFYPDHFTTKLGAAFPCLPAMHCAQASADPAAPAYGVSGAVYSGQAFSVTVNAFSLPRPGLGPQPLALYTNAADPARAIQLAPVAAPNASAAPAGGSYALVQALPAAATPLSGQAAYTLAARYDPAAPRAGNWSAPLPVYLRASALDYRMVASKPAPQAITISSQAAPAQYEDGLNVVAGRVLVDNVFGSELARLPLALTAQYWTGTLWQTNTNDNDSLVATSLKFSNCTRSFVGNCQLTALAPAGGPGLQLAAGAGRLTLKAPARGWNGSIDIGAVNDPAANPAAASWLPSTLGRATFGLFKSPLIYLREMY